jgi:hypothetical protein
VSIINRTIVRFLGVVLMAGAVLGATSGRRGFV